MICKEIGDGLIELRGEVLVPIGSGTIKLRGLLCRSAVYIAPFVDLSVSGLLQIRLFGRMAH